MSDKISVIVPCYNEEPVLHMFYDEMSRVSAKMKDVDFEYIFINDGSRDKTLEILKNLHQKDQRVKYISFSRNFGKEAAMLAGLERSIGNYVAIMDADLQDPPSLLPEMYSILKDENMDYDSVATRRVTRKGEPVIRSFFARNFYKIINAISNADIVDGARDYRLMNRKFVDAILSMKEYNRFSKGIFGWVGFNTKWLEYENVQRAAGETKWSFWKLFLYSIDGIIGFSVVPLYLASIVGALMCFLSILMIIVVVVKTIVIGNPASGWASILSVILLLSGVQLLGTGILGGYLSKTYLEVKDRPRYIVKETEESRC